jgi:hypothetical protein
MRVLLDESLPRQLKTHLPGHQVLTVTEIGWTGKKNGELLALAEGRFDVFVTPDRNLPDQQNLSRLQLAIVVVRARSTDLEDLLPLVPGLLQYLSIIVPGQLVRLIG